MARKVREYFEAGVMLVWLIDPRKRTARVFSTSEKSSLIRADQSLDGGEVLPGFVLPLADLLDRGPAASARLIGSPRHKDSAMTDSPISAHSFGPRASHYHFPYSPLR